MRVRFLLHGPLGATQFLFQFRYHPYGDPLLDRRLTVGWDLGFHSIAPIDGATDMEECDVVPGGRCHYDGSSLQTEELCALFLKDGEAVVWEWLEDRYNVWLVRDSGATE